MKDQIGIKGTTKPLMANLDMSPHLECGEVKQLFSVSGCESIELPDYSVYTTCTQWLHYPFYPMIQSKEDEFSFTFRLAEG